ncbi:MAG: DMT family transporter [Phycisphaeraceae bacterium]|nr:DMT family transporter [Phycisphaeraceae bacterium]
MQKAPLSSTSAAPSIAGIARTGYSTPTSTPSAGLGIALILTSLSCWTTIPLFLRHFKDQIDGWSANGWRYGFSALLWLPLLLFAMRRGTIPPGLWRAALWPSLFNTAAQVCFGLAPYFVEPGLMTFSLRLQIVFVTFGAAMMFPAERMVIRKPGFIAGIAMVVIGTLLTVWLKPGGLGSGTGIGVALSIASGLLYAGYALSVRATMHGMPPLLAFSAVSQYTAALMLVLMVIFSPTHGAQITHLVPGQLALLLLSAVIGIGIGHTAYFKSIQALGLAVSAGVVQLQPITVSIVAPFLFPNDEHLTGAQWATGLMAVAGAATMLITQHLASRRRAIAPIDEFDDLPVDPDVALVAQSNESPPDSVPERD